MKIKVLCIICFWLVFKVDVFAQKEKLAYQFLNELFQPTESKDLAIYLQKKF